MTKSIYNSNVNRREFLKHSGSLVAGSAMLGSISPIAFARDDNTIRLALIGCGGRGAGAVGDALNVPDAGPVKLYAMADLNKDRMESRLKPLKERLHLLTLQMMRHTHIHKPMEFVIYYSY